jgi:rhodanese-related sulfurtransferase
VHCAAGYRASIAASILAAAGRRVVIVDDDFAPRHPEGASGVSTETSRPTTVDATARPTR